MAPQTTAHKAEDAASTAATVASKAIMDIKHPKFNPTPDATPTMHTGGVVPKDGKYVLQGGEKVIPKEEAPKTSMYRAMHHLRKGGLHEAVGVPNGENIPAEKLEAAHKSDNPHVAAMAKLHSMRGK
jgi:hypothetical protein